MFQFDITQWVPQFLLNDKNGYALAKAIGAALQMMNDIIDEGVNVVIDYETMPEWRLDELAWETNCLYDYHADVETKRQWIMNAIPYYRMYGTPAAIHKFIGSYFDNVEVEENWIYEGNPYHFRVFVEGVWNPANEAWARKAIDRSKNVRSVLDNLAIGCRSYLALTAEVVLVKKFPYPLTGPTQYAGTWPQENIIAVIDKTGRMGAQGDAAGHKFPYPMTGTRPEINTIGVLDNGGRAGMTGDAPGYRFPYPMTSDGVKAGTTPQENKIGKIVEAQAGSGAEAKGYRFGYPLTGTLPQENTIGEVSRNNIQSAQAEDSYYAILYKMCGQDEF